MKIDFQNTYFQTKGDFFKFPMQNYHTIFNSLFKLL